VHAGGVQPRGGGEERGEDARGRRAGRTARVGTIGPMSAGSFYLTTPIYYVNGEPHIGHAYTTIMADVVARHHRQREERVFFLTGTDEHGAKVERSAEAAGRTPREHADVLSARFRAMGESLGATNDFFIRTSDPEHEAAVGEVMERLRESGDVYKDSYAGWYCSHCEAFYRENELVDGSRCPIHGTEVEWLEQENWFFRLSAYRDRLLAILDRDPEWVLPAVRANEARRMMEEVEDLSISRAQLEWGVPVPWDPEQVVYVWVDALFNYYTALTYARPGEDLVGALWPPDLQLMAKDILKFHAVIWPALLMSAGLELPKRLFVHGFVLKGGEKMSKTLGNVVDPFPFIERYGVDALRYYLVREVSFGEDGIFSAEGFDARYNGELANELGNLLNRTVSMIGRYRDGRVPPDPGTEGELAAEIGRTVAGVRERFDRVELTRAAEEAWVLVRRLNRLAEERAPWTLAKDPARARELDAALVALAEGLRAAAILLWPVMPGSCERALVALGQPAGEVALARAEWGAGVAEAQVAPTGQLFPRVEEREPIS
jgi:methionyl-tRNA synthetase